MKKLKLFPGADSCAFPVIEIPACEAAESPSTLDRLDIGDRGRVLEIRVSGGMRRRLMDIGLIEGVAVECLHKSPGGDPAAYLICGAVIALRNEDAEKVNVILISD